ncbi:MAG: energy-coupling factor transporter transmembrane protein EcfT [Treponema sp.]|jgi:energy-coupling factor transport system permease protein|nr:energy-coupling factor transporter transmembrane protein EcfT [Treponema sp.]
MKLDPRTKLFALVLINVVVFSSPDMTTEWLCMGVIALTLAVMGCRLQLARGLAVYAGMIGALYLCGFADNFITAFISMIVICFRKIMPTVFFASGFLATTKAGELVSAMQRLRIPRVIIIPFTVTLRFFPTAREEFAAIRDAARLRGLRFSMERTLVPMMLRCANIAEELSAASVARGIESAGKRTSIYELRLGFQDYAVSAVFTALAVFRVMGGVPLFYG